MREEKMNREEGREDEILLQEIQIKEAELEEMLVRAREEAKRIIESARIQGENLKEEAKKKLAQLTQKYQERAQKEIDQLEKETLSKAMEEGVRLKKLAAERMEKAVQKIIEAVLP